MLVIAYSDPRKLDQHPLWDEVSRYPQFCATGTLASGMQKCYGGPGGPWNASINLIFGQVFPCWMRSTTYIEQFARLTGLTDRLKKRWPSSKKSLDSFRRNQKSVLDAIRTLVEGGVRPSELTPHNDEQELFCILFDLFIKEDSYVHRFEKTFESLTSPSEALAVLNKAMFEAARKVDLLPVPSFSDFDAVVFHGFYFITPFQNRFMKALQAAGLDIYHLICWDRSFPSVFSVWESFYDGKEEWMADTASCTQPLGQFFASLYEKGQARPPGAPISVIEFPTVGSFVSYVSETAGPDGKFQECYCSPSSKDLNKVLREYFPEHYDDRHFLSYPAGQFLYHLHRMWNEQDRSLAIDENGLKACLASGMLRLNDWSPALDIESATIILSKCLPFFEGCRTVDDWRDRLRELHKAILAAEELDPENADRFSLAVENPFRFLAFVISKDEFQVLHSVIEQLFSTAEYIFSRPEVSLREHLVRLKEIIASAEDSAALIDEERELVKKVLSDLTPETASDTPFPAKDLSEAIAVYLATDEDKHEDEVRRQKRLVQSFESLDGLPLLEDRPLHLCMLAADSLPARKSFCPWPLTLECLPEHSDVRRLIQAREESSPKADLYLFYSALAFAPKVILSWIREWEDELKDISPYLLMIVDPTGAKLDPFPASLMVDIDISAAATCKKIKVAGPVRLEYPSHVAAEHDFCPRRFFYSYIVYYRTRFESSFHHSFQFSRLIDWYRARFGAGQHQARQFVGGFFPHWSKTKKTLIADMWSDTEPTLSGRPIPDVVRRILFPGKPHQISFTKTRKLNLADGDSSERARLQLEANPGEHCRYCPHQRLCGDTLFPVDS